MDLSKDYKYIALALTYVQIYDVEAQEFVKYMEQNVSAWIETLHFYDGSKYLATGND